MDVLFGVATKECVVLASDKYFRKNVIVSKTDHIRCTKVSDKVAVISTGDQGDCERTIQYIVELLKYEGMANNLEVTERTFTSMLQNHIHSKLRKDPVEVILIVGGFSEEEGKIFFVDQYGAVSSTRYIGTGYASNLFLSAMDQTYREDMTQEEIIKVIEEIYRGIKERLVINYGDLHFCTISPEGITER